MLRVRRRALLASGLLAAPLVLGGAGVALARGLNGPATASGTTAGPSVPDQGSSGTSGAAYGMMGSVGAMSDSGMMGSGGSMGGAGMMGGGIGGPVTTSSPAAARALARQLTAGADVNRQTKTITYHTAQVAFAALASPDGEKDMTWNVGGLVNPTIVIPKGAQVTVHFFDADTGTPHGWELTTTPPPYPSMVMMDAQVAFPGAFAMPVSGATAQQWFGRTVRFTATTAGTYYYLCPVPGHAQQGMAGRLVVS
ncbi:MAG: plastocyanin/azurin family copper-binding protein [Chloroflexi bacterium]|nr:plastocyanin/azurin family copper-binding protein [Chloroflexota bacterium]